MEPYACPSISQQRWHITEAWLCASGAPHDNGGIIVIVPLLLHNALGECTGARGFRGAPLYNRAPSCGHLTNHSMSTVPISTMRCGQLGRTKRSSERCASDVPAPDARVIASSVLDCNKQRPCIKSPILPGYINNMSTALHQTKIYISQPPKNNKSPKEYEFNSGRL